VTDWGQKASAAICLLKPTETKKASQHFKKSSQHFTKASIPLKMYLKTLAVLEKVSICLKKSKNILNSYNSPTFLNKIVP
jgi:hypothetical protein